MANKLAVIGDKDSVMLWRALGVETVFASSSAEVDRAIHRLAREGAAVIYITEQCLLLAGEAVERYLTEPFPAIIPIPNAQGTMGLGMKQISANVEKAIGADILFDNEE